MVGAGLGVQRLRPFGSAQGRPRFTVRRQQRDDALLAAVRQLDEALEAGEQFDGRAQAGTGSLLFRHGGGGVLLGERGYGGTHGSKGVFERRRGLGYRLQRALAIRLCLGGGRVAGLGRHGVELAEHAAGAGTDLLLAFAQVRGCQPRWWRPRLWLGGGRNREGRGVRREFDFVAQHGLQHLHRVQQLLPGPFERREGGVRPAVGAFSFQPSQASPRVAQGLASPFEIVGRRRKLVRAALLFRRALGIRQLLDEQPFLRRQVHAVAHLGQERPLAAGQAVEFGLEAQGFRVGAGLADVGQQAAQPIAHTALVVDQPVEGRCEPVAGVQLIGQLQDAAGDQLQVHAGIVVFRRRQPHRVVEPGRGLAQSLDGLRRLGVLANALRQRIAEIEGGAIAQLGIRAGVVSGGKERVGGRGVVLGGELR